MAFKNFIKKYPNYNIVEAPSKEFIDSFRGNFPDELLLFWKEYGFGSFMNGYLKLVNPLSYQDIFKETYLHYKSNQHVFAVTSLCDLLVWDGDTVELINYRHGYSEVVGSDEIDWYFNMDLTEEYYLSKRLKADNYSSARDKLGEPDFDECYGYTPILAVGGSENVKNLQKEKIKEHISLISQLAGKIE